MKNCRKVLSFILAFAIMLSVVSVGASVTVSAATNGTTGSCTWSLDGTVLTISGNGPMADYGYRGPWGSNITDVIINDGVTSIGDCAFRNCNSLTSITIPDSVESIGDHAFCYCGSLTSVTIPDSVTKIGYYAFSDCDSLTSITVDNENKYYSSDERGVLFNKDKTKVIQYPAGNKAQEYIIPDSVTSIGDHAFEFCNSLTSIEIPDSVTSIGDYAFPWCNSLTSITIPDSVTSIGDYAFDNCDSLTSITIPDSVTSIGDAAFNDCDSLTSIEIPDSVTSIGDYAFYWCNSLTSITIPDSVESIGDHAFCYCGSLTSVTIPDSVTKIGYYAFSECYSLETVFYRGSETQKKKISIDYNNSYLLSATWHYNSCIGSANHTYDNVCDEICNICDAIRTAPHDFEWKTDKENNCGVDGYKHEECMVCHIKRNENTVIAATGEHKYDNSCDEICNICDAIRTAPHDFEWKTDKENNCGVDGYKHEECMVCHIKRNENTVIAATGNHDFKWIIDKENNCIVDGYKHEECTVCHIKRNENTVIAATGNHDFKWIIDKENNCGVDGYKHEECTVCHIKRNENTGIPATGNHSYTDATCTDPKTCKVCGVTSGSKLGHSYKKYLVKATLTANGKDGYKCSRCGYVTSTTKTIYRPTSFKLSTTTYTYNGAVKTPTVTVKDSAGKTISSSNYTVTYASGRKNVGTYKVTVKMKGNYTGTKTLTFKINPINISKCKVSLSKTAFTYNGKMQAPTVTVKNANGTKLTNKTHYTITYASGRKNVGTYKVTVKMKGNYTGTKVLTFTIKPKAASINTLTAKSKALSVKLNRSLQQSTGYQIQYSTSKSFKSYKTKTITSYKTSTTTLTGLKAKTTYYVRVRTYKTVGKTKIYSNWSTAKSKKTK